MSVGPEYYFGPAIAVAADLAEEYKPVHVDLSTISRNLKRDFPEYSQEDWSRAMIRITDDLPEYGGGFALNLDAIRKSKSARILQKIIGKFQRIPNFSYKKYERLSGGADVFVQINIDPKINADEDPYIAAYSPLSPSEVLAHELKHAVDHLRHPLGKKEVEEISKLSRINLTRLGGAVTGLVMFAGNALVGFVALAEEEVKTGYKIPVAGMIGGLCLAVVSASSWVTRINKLEKWEDMFGQYYYATGEDAAHSYAIATQRNWAGVIQSGVEDISAVDDWFDNS